MASSICVMNDLQRLHPWEALIGRGFTKKVISLLDQILDLRAKGHIIYPVQTDIINALTLCHPKDIKVVILGQDPYHEEGQAMGLSFSVPNGCPLPPSLQNIYKERKEDLAIDISKSGDLSAWAKQGVLLLNTVLTVEKGRANSHKDFGWQEITTDVLRALMRKEDPVVFACWGKQALELVTELAKDPLAQNNYGIKSTHPSPLAAHKSTRDLPSFIGSHPFSHINKILIDNNLTPIDWRNE